MTESTRWSRWPALIALAGWVWAVLWSFAAVMSYLSITAYVRAGVVLVLAVVVGAGLWNTDWTTTSVKIMLWVRHADFAAVASAYENGGPLDIPWWMSELAIDGDVQPQDRGLYFPVSVGWRSETGSGFAYIPGGPGKGELFQTAAGDVGAPTTDLGGGWWWVE